MLVLGGNFSTPGNITPLSEYNIWADPEAARIVLNAELGPDDLEVHMTQTSIGVQSSAG